MSTGYSSRAWACPFLKWDEKLKVHCEGGCVAFPDRDAYAEYTGRYCANVPGWQGCSLAASLMQYYERTDDDGTQHRQNQAAGE